MELGYSKCSKEPSVYQKKVNNHTMIIAVYVVAMKHCLRYLKGTTTLGLNFKRCTKVELSGFSDSSHNVDLDDERSTTGNVFYLGESPISWWSKKQDTVAMSSCEADSWLELKQ